jgi:transcriptional regulator with XRE-family HTH domain
MWTGHAVKRTKQSVAKNIIGKRIREARRKCRPAVSQDALAGRLAARGVTLDQTAISRIENRDRYLMDYEIAAIAKSLRVPVAWLFGENEG